jgi:hypothetical protein
MLLLSVLMATAMAVVAGIELLIATVTTPLLQLATAQLQPVLQRAVATLHCTVEAATAFWVPGTCLR